MNFDIIKFHSQFCNTDMGTYYNTRSKYCDREKIIMPEKNHLCNLDVHSVFVYSHVIQTPLFLAQKGGQKHGSYKKLFHFKEQKV